MPRKIFKLTLDITELNSKTNFNIDELEEHFADQEQISKIFAQLLAQLLCTFLNRKLFRIEEIDSKSVYLLFGAK